MSQENTPDQASSSALSQDSLTPLQRVIYTDHINRERNLKELFEQSFLPSQRALAEEAFITYFLPWLSGEVQDTDGKILQSWLQVAGDSLTQVMLTDRTGQVVALVPGIVDRSTLEIKTDRRKNVRNILAQAEKIGELAANASFEQAYTGLVDALGVERKPATSEWLQAWSTLLLRYGKHPANKLALTDQSQSNKPKDDDIFEFED